MCTGSYKPVRPETGRTGAEPARCRRPRPVSAGPNHAQHPTFERRARFLRREDPPFEAHPEAINEDARDPEAGHLDDCRGSELDERAERHPLESQSGGADVLAEVAGADLEAGYK